MNVQLESSKDVSPLLFSLNFHELEKLLEEAAANVDCRVQTGGSMAILLVILPSFYTLLEKFKGSLIFSASCMLHMG